MNIGMQFEDSARRQIAEAEKKQAGPYQHEWMQGHWDIPDGLKATRTCMDTNRKLFKLYPDFAFLAGFNPMHVHHRADLSKERGCWWIYGADPGAIPREYGMIFPCISMKIDGEWWIERFDSKGEPFHPNENWELIAKTLKWKDIFSGMHGKDVAANVRASNEAKEKLDEDIKRRVDAHRKYWIEHEGMPIAKDASSTSVPENYVKQDSDEFAEGSERILVP